MHKLNMQSVADVDELAWPAQKNSLNLSSPALEFFTDFDLAEPKVVEASVPAQTAREMMLKTHVRLKIVVNEKNDFLGVVSSEDISEQNILKKASFSRVPREEMLVSDFMTPKKDLLAFSLEEIEKAKIEDVVEMLKDSHQQHCLVVDRKEHKIHGIFSASDISRKLKLPIDIQDQSNFYKVFAAVQ